MLSATQVLERFDTANGWWSRLLLGLDDDVTPLPRSVRWLCASVAEHSSSPGLKLIIVPRLHDASLWASVGASLVAMREQAFSAAMDEGLEPLHPGQLVLVDNRYTYEYAGSCSPSSRCHRSCAYLGPECRGRHWLDASSGRTSLQRSHRPRISPCPYQSQLYKGAPPKEPEVAPLDDLLDIRTHGPRFAFEAGVVLVTGVGAATQGLRECRARVDGGPARPLSSLLDWGSTNGGEYPAGTAPRNPLLLVPSATAARDWFRARQPRNPPVIVVDGARRLAQAAASIRQLVGLHCPVVALVERGDEEDAATCLNQLGPAVAMERLTDEDAGELAGSDEPYGTGGEFVRSLGISGRLRIRAITVPDEHLDAAHASISSLPRSATDETELAQPLYAALTTLSRVFSPVLTAPLDRADQDLIEAQDRLEREASYLSAEAYRAARSAIDALVLAASARRSGQCPKGTALRDHLADGAAPVTVALPGRPADVGALEADLGYRAEGTGVPSSTRFVSAGDTTRLTEMDRLIVGAWLRRDRMSRLLQGYWTEDVGVLVHGFEARWLAQACQRWQLRYEAPVLATVPQVEPGAPAVVGAPTPEIEYVEELAHRQHGVVRTLTKRDELASVTCVRLANGKCMLLSQDHRVMAITRAIEDPGTDRAEHTPLAQLEPGDYILLRPGAQSDLIRAQADRLMSSDGQFGLRTESAAWRDTLHGWLDPGELAKLMRLKRQLDAAGCQVSLGTLSRWLSGSGAIGPSNRRAIDVIAEVTGNARMQSRTDNIKAAITDLRHLRSRATAQLNREGRLHARAGKPLRPRSRRAAIWRRTERLAREAGKPWLRQMANTWRTALTDWVEATQVSRIARLLRLLRARQCGVEADTLYRWLVDDSRIGPRDLPAVEVIATVTADDDLQSAASRVQHAIKWVRSYHAKARAKLAAEIPGFLAHSGLARDAARDGWAQREHAELGLLSVYRVEEIGAADLQVSWTAANRLLDDDYW